jgi:hypothetical protein
MMSADQRIVTAIPSSTHRFARTGVLVNIAMLSVGYITTKAAASAATPPKKHLRAAYCRKNQ